MADPGAARPVLDDVADLRERHVDVALAQLPGDVGDPGAEHEAVHAVAIVGHRVHEVQQHARVALHRARDVAQDDERRMAADAALLGEVDHGAAAVQRAPQRPAQIDPPAARIGVEAAVGTARIGRRMARISAWACAISSADMSSKSLCCSTSLAEKVSVASSSIVSSASSGARLRRQPLRRERLGETPCHLLGRRGVGLDLRQQQLHRLLEQIGLAPEDVERLVEQLALVAPVHEHGVQGPVEVAGGGRRRPPRPRAAHPAPCPGRQARRGAERTRSA